MQEMTAREWLIELASELIEEMIADQQQEEREVSISRQAMGLEQPSF